MKSSETGQSARTSSRKDPLGHLFAPLRPSAEETAALRAIEKSGDLQKFARELAAQDRKYKDRSLEKLGIDRQVINDSAFRRPTEEERARNWRFPAGIPSVLIPLLDENKLACDCLVPFKFSGLNVYNNMTGPENNQVTRGMIGANRYYANEFTVWNPGDTSGTTRVHLHGQMHISFSATLPAAGRWCLIMPSGPLQIRGHTRVVGHGNYSTSYDAKVWIDYYQVLQVGSVLLELSGGEIHYDGTRSEDRTKYFEEDRYLSSRYIFLQAPHANDYLLWTLRLEVDTAANEDGIATGVIDHFGFLANSTHDYDTFAIKA